MRNANTSVLFSVVLFAFVGRSDGCTDHAKRELVGVRVGKHSPAPTQSGPPIATIELESGSTVMFLDVGEGRVGVAEKAPQGAPLLTDVLVEKWDPTPLELFLALAPDSSVPDVLRRDVLRRDHAASTTEPPRDLELPPAQGVPIDNFDCDPPSKFEDDWSDTYSGVTEVVVSESYEPFPWEQFDWYPGLAAYLGTNNNLTTHFGICSADTNTPYTVQVHRRLGPGSWHQLVTAGIGFKARFTFHNNIPGIYRMRLVASGGTPISAIAAGAAYTPAPPIAPPPGG